MTSNPLTSVSHEKLPSMPQSAANAFFHNPDFCTLLAETLLSITLPSTTTTTKPCQITIAPLLLTFRAITRSTHNAVMLERPTRAALSLEPQASSSSALGVLVMPAPERADQEFDPTTTTPYVSHSEPDIAALLAQEVEDEQDEQDEQGEGEGEDQDQQGRKEYVRHDLMFTDPIRCHERRYPRPYLARIFTHHPAIIHRLKYTYLTGTTLRMTPEDFSLCSTLPLARQMFLTQPPQKKIAFWVRYEYCPGTRRVFTLRNEDGIRFGELVDFLEREPGMMKRAVDPKGVLGRYRRWLRDGEFVWMNRVEWDVGRGAERGGPLWRWAHGDMRPVESEDEEEEG